MQSLAVILQQCWLGSHVTKLTQNTAYQDCQHLKEKLSHQPHKIIVFFAKVTVRLAKLPQFEEYLAKQDHKD
jgi:hypothetical protein